MGAVRRSILCVDTAKHVVLLMVYGFLTFVNDYGSPGGFFWDENYHVASAQKYLNDVYFMEPHPPFGKLMIALGEIIVDANDGYDDNFIGTDYGTDPPEDMSLVGYRLFPVLFMWLCVPVMWMIVYLVTLRRWVASLGTWMLIFDNALIVHARGAMLEPIQIFFVLTTLMSFLFLRRTWHQAWPRRWWALAMGLSFGLTLATKYSSLFIILLWPLLPILLWNRWRALTEIMAISIASAVLVFMVVWQIHFASGRVVIDKLPDDGFYSASDQIKASVTKGEHGKFGDFTTHLSDSLSYASRYEKGVPKLNLCKEDENGSLWFTWPFGGRNISYKWRTPDGKIYSYLYLVPNPATWFFGLLGIIFTTCAFVMSLLAKKRPRFLSDQNIILGLYWGYMIGMSRIDRVMYLYHYFIPLILSFVLFCCFISNLRWTFGRFISRKIRYWILGTLAFIVAGTFLIYKPFTYYEPMNDAQVKRRAILDLWELRCVNCPHESQFVEYE